jgi:hypothetical protein
VSFEAFRSERERVRKNNALIRDRSALWRKTRQRCLGNWVKSWTNLSRHVVKRVEDRVKVGDEELRREGSEEGLSISANVGRNHGAVSETGL